MRVNHVRRRLEAGEPSIGTWLSLPSPEAAEYVAELGLDWLVVDTEHNAIDIATLARMFMAMRASGVAPMVRIPWNTAENVKRVLDAGAWGIVFPMVNSREEAELAVEAARYHPAGNRSVGGGRHGMSFGSTSKEYYENANAEVLVVVQIEHIRGVEHADEILSVPGVDACFIGPNDLAASMGHGLGVSLETDITEVVSAIEAIRDTCRKHGVTPGIHTSGAAAVQRRIGEGFQFCAMASELKYMVGSMASDLQNLDWSPSDRTQQSVGTAAEAGTLVRY
ncbi:MAG TPA: aldolase/citrate lyase family protein [Thermomicrobiales bacterium]|nr:aldolase/citrate lyase family protein [Thermomicrobiales bacterium]